MKMWSVSFGDQTVQNVQSDLDLHYPQKLPMLSSVWKELTLVQLRISVFGKKEKTEEKSKS